MKKYLILLFSALLLTAVNAFAQVKIIFDTDFGGDVDDLGALVMLHNFVDKGECNLLAVMCWSTEQYSVSAVDAVNRCYGHPGIPIGTRKDSTHYESWNYSKTIADKFPHKLSYREAEDATFLYRKLLAASEDKSIVIITVGPLMNIQKLINSGADAISNLNGKELIEKKVKEFVIMGGQFPEGKKEWNFDGAMPGVTQFVLHNITVPVTFLGFEIGVVIKTGEVFNQIDPNTPLYAGFMHFSQNAPWVKENFKGKILDNATYDQTAVLYAVRNGVGTFWDRVEGGYCAPDKTEGGNKWISGPLGNQSYLKLKMDPEEMALLIESIMLNKF
jgi:inosine-uridine nucleoside N-ribohydrolase